MLRSGTELNLARFLREISRVEIASELKRVSLNNSPNFDAYAAFYTLDSAQEGYIKLSDLYTFLVLNKASVTHSDLDLLFKVYDKNRDGLLSYSEFLNLILPADIERRHSPTRKSHISPYSSKYLSKTAQLELALLIEREVQGLKLINELKIELLDSSDWNTKVAFQSIDIGNDGYLDRVSLGSFFRRNGFTLDREDIHALLRRLDKDYDGRISYYEFANAVEYPERILSQSNTFSDRYRKSPRRSSRSQSPDRETRYRQYTDELVKSILLRNEASRGRSRSPKIRDSNIDRINEMVDSCLKKSLENRIRSMQSSPLRTRSREPRYSTLYDDELYRRPRSRGSLSPYTSPSRSTGFDSAKNLPRRNRVDDDSTKYFGSQDPLDALVARTLQRSRDLRSRSRSPRRYEAEKLSRSDYYPKYDSEIKRGQLREPYSTSGQKDSFLRSDLDRSETKSKAPEQKYSEVEENFQTPKKEAHSASTDTEQKQERNSELKASDLKSQMKLTPMKGQEEHILVKALQEIIELDQALENIRESLVHQKDYTPLLAYHTLLDPESTNACDANKLAEVLSYAKIQVSEKEFQLVFQRLDRDGDSKISEKDFEEIVYPKDRKLAKELGERALETELSSKTLEIITEFLRQIVLTERKVEEIRKRLSKRSLFDIEDAFKVLDNTQEGAITEEGFQNLLEKYGIKVSTKQLENLIQRFDTDFDGKINLNEFYRGLVPNE